MHFSDLRGDRAARYCRAVTLRNLSIGAFLGLVLALGACGGGSDADVADTTAGSETGTDTGDDGPSPYLEPGPYGVGRRTFTMPDASGERSLVVEVWYPTDAAVSPDAVEAFEEGERLAALQPLLAAAPDSCTRKDTSAQADLALADGAPWPLVAYSHCSACTRWSGFSLAERMASHGIAVAAVDHDGNTLWETLDGDGGGLSPDGLTNRVADLELMLDVLLATGDPRVPGQLHSAFDPERVGVMGHSFGASTIARALQDDPRTKAGVALAAPLAFLGGTDIPSIEQPVLMLRALEDNSIGTAGNALMLDQFNQLGGRGWFLDAADAGHWSFHDIAGLDESFEAGCGEAVRMTDGSSFTYTDNAAARDAAAYYATAFFALTLNADPGAEADLDELVGPVVEVTLK